MKVILIVGSIAVIVAMAVLVHGANASPVMPPVQQYNSACLDNSAIGCSLQGGNVLLQGSSPTLQGN